MGWFDALKRVLSSPSEKSASDQRSKNSWLCDLAHLADLSRFLFEDLSKPERVFRAIWEVEAEVNNGGFHQFYDNSSGDLAAFTDQALEEIGAPKMADIVRRSRAVFPKGEVPKDWEKRQEVVLEFSEDQVELLEELSREFQHYPEDLTELLYAYVQANLQAIREASDMAPL